MLVGIHSVSVLGRKHVFAHQRDDHRIGVVVSRHIGDGLSVKAVQYQRPLVHVGFRQVCHIEAGIVARHHECVVIAAGSPLDFPTGGQVEHLSVVHDHLDAGISRRRRHSGLRDGLLLRQDGILRGFGLRGRLRGSRFRLLRGDRRFCHGGRVETFLLHRLGVQPKAGEQAHRHDVKKLPRVVGKAAFIAEKAGKPILFLHGLTSLCIRRSERTHFW